MYTVLIFYLSKTKLLKHDVPYESKEMGNITCEAMEQALTIFIRNTNVWEEMIYLCP